MLLICHEYKNIVLLLLAYNEWDKHSYTHRERAKDREPVATETSSSDKHPKPKRLIVDCVSLFVLHAAFSVCLFVYTFRCMNFCSFLSFHFSQKQWVIWFKCCTLFIFVYTLPNQIHSIFCSSLNQFRAVKRDLCDWWHSFWLIWVLFLNVFHFLWHLPFATDGFWFVET